MTTDFPRRVATLPLLTAATIMMTTAPAAASSVDTLDCQPPESLIPLITLLNTLTELAFIAGVGLGVLGFSVAALCLMLPGEHNTRRGKMIAKNTLIGVILLLSADIIVGFLVNELGGVVCS